MATTIRRTAAARALFEAVRGARAEGAPGVGERLAALPRMLVLGMRGSYPYLRRSRLVLSVLALLYLISPIDLMPEALLWVFGLGDDALVAAWLAGAVLSETGTFLAWERARDAGASRIVVGEVVE